MEDKCSYRGRDPLSREVLEIAVANGCIAGVQSVVDAACDQWLVPGLVDLQVNGYGGIDLNDVECDTASVRRLVHLLVTLGTTSFFPTIITGTPEKMLARVQTIAEARRDSSAVAHAIPGIHLEGPNISAVDGYRGAHPLADVRSPSLAEFDQLQAAADGLVKLVTLSPHWPDAIDYIRALRTRGVVVALGHTHALRKQIAAAVDAGAQLSTHLGNGLAAELHRHGNPLWPQLADDRLSASVIADGVHLPDDLLRVLLRTKGTARTVLISDSVGLAGCAAGPYRSPIGGDVMVGEDGSIRMRESSLLAGSGIALKDAIAHVASLPGCTLADAVAMATTNSAKCLGLQRGALNVGASADLLLFRWEQGSNALHIVDVVVQGLSVTSDAEQKEGSGGNTL